jgi:DNA-binding NtrC family response regulator
VSPTSGASGQEVLVVDNDRSVLKGLERLLTAAGLTVTTLTDAARARDQVEKRFIPVVLCDLDTPEPGAGVDLVKFAKEKSPLTAVIVMTNKKTFEVVAPAFRAGAADVIPKTQETVPYLRERVLKAATETRSADTRERLLVDVAETHEDFLRRMMDLSKQVTDLEDKILAREGSISSSTELTVVHLLLVDDAPALNAVLTRDLPADKGWRIRYAQSGGEALDVATQTPPNILVVNETLPDLPATMVIKTIKSRTPDVVTLLFSAPGEGGTGEVKMVDQSKLLMLIPSFSAPDQLVASLLEVREGLRQKLRERRYLQNFRKQHLEFIQKYNALKQRLGKF